MRTRIVPASELDPKKGFRASDYIKGAVPRDREARLKALKRFGVARAKYLKFNGWVLSERRIPGAPRWWKDPNPEPGEQQEHREDHAVWQQEMRDNDLMREGT